MPLVRIADKEGSEGPNEEVSARGEVSFPWRLVTFGCEEGISPIGEVEGVDLAKREGILVDWRRWMNFSNALSPPHGLRGVEEEGALLRTGAGLDVDFDKVEEGMSTCMKIHFRRLTDFLRSV